MSSTDYDLDLDGEHQQPVHIATVEEKKRLWWRNAAINSLFIAGWFIFATLLSVYNKWMFDDQHFGFSYPLFVTTLHMFVQLGLASILRFVWPQHFRPRYDPSRRDYLTKATPTAAATSLDIGFSNLSLKTISLTFYTMVKSSSLIFVLAFAFLFKLEVFSKRLIGVIFLIFSGVILMVATESHFVLGGFLLVLSASALGGFRWSLTHLLLKDHKMGLDNPAATVFWLAPPMGLTLAVVSLAIESWHDLFASHFFNGFFTTLNTLFFLILPGVLAFCMVMSEYYIIQRAGVVPMSIAGIAKEVTTITISSWFFGDELTPLNITGVGITVCGITLYTYHKYRKSIESEVPLDDRGNPIAAEELDGMQYDALAQEENAVALTSRMSDDAVQDSRTADDSRLLFSVADDSDLEDTNEDARGVTRV